ncbi:MAG: serine hydrolase domain-containing protein [Alphaproteobacteria bacterium]
MGTQTAKKIPFTAQTIAQIGSITKTFTALAIMKLASEGKVDLSKPAKAYLPGGREPAASSTLESLLTHTAGISEYCGDDFARRTRAEVLSVCMAMPLEHKAGEYAYSNTGYSILAAIVEEVTHQSWEEALDARIWQPFGMTRAGWLFPGRAHRDFAVGYLDNKPQGLISDKVAALGGEAWNLKGNGGLQVSAADMHRFYRGLKAQPAAIFSAMTAPHADQGEGAFYGYGLNVRVDKAGKPWRIGHGGSDGVFLSYFAWLPQQDTFIYFVGNNGEEPARTSLRGALKTLQDAVGAGPGK